MIAAYNLDEMVDLHALNRPFQGPSGYAMARKVATLPLREAVALVIEEWSDDKFRQLSAVIVRHSGPAIRSFEEIRDLHAKLRPPQPPDRSASTLRPSILDLDERTLFESIAPPAKQDPRSCLVRVETWPSG